ncbi:ribosome maturation factor RimM [Glutamicibacter endophyticus]|uniref:ribosome maturation factor RimM n=1 Tax=Glutamicibacter sp. PS TaxID=3075634 RepID=UPI00283FBE34|nr:ribosome maturation factor RimM [Glutamicibacter sp. PS]MDR4532929.1 ribosome maturation factor RimM [Glutamicibacter sp. PS]
MRLQVARIGKPHGIRGEVTVQVLTDAPEERFTPGTVLQVVDGPVAELTIKSARWNKSILLLGFEEIADRNAAETLRQARLEFDSDEEEDDDSDQWYEHELLDLKVMFDGTQIGIVTGLRTNPAQDLLVFERSDGQEVYLPFVDEFVPDIDTEAGTLSITPPAGLLELNDDEEA